MSGIRASQHGLMLLRRERAGVPFSIRKRGAGFDAVVEELLADVDDAGALAFYEGGGPGLRVWEGGDAVGFGGCVFRIGRRTEIFDITGPAVWSEKRYWGCYGGGSQHADDDHC